MEPLPAPSTNSFLGRERELTELRAALDDVNAGRGRLFLLSGEPGIGKTRLAEEIAHEAAARGMRAIWGRSWEGGGAPAYWPWVQILRTLVVDPNRQRNRGAVVSPEVAQMLPELASEALGQSPSDPKQAQFRLFDAVNTTLKDASRVQPLVLIFDDLHEADQSTLEMLKFVGRALRDSSLLIVGTCRDVEVRLSAVLSEAISEIVRDGRQMTLGGLLPDEVGRMVAARSNRSPSSGFIRDLHQATAGNPLFVDGILRMLLANDKIETTERLEFSGFRLPEGVRGAINKRLAMLSSAARELLIVAAAIGQEFHQAVLQRVSQASVYEVRRLLREAAEIGIVATDCDPARFSHPLIREALRLDTAEDESVRMHNRIGEAIEEIHAANLISHTAELAYHYERAGKLEKAIDNSNRAAQAASRLYAFQQALNFSETALRLMEKRGEPAKERARQLLQIAAFASAFTNQRAIDCLEKAVTLFDKEGDTEASAAAHVKIGQLLCTTNTPTNTMNIDRAFIHYAIAEKALKERPASEAVVGMYRGIAHASWESARMKESVAAARLAVEIAEKVGREDVWLQAADALAFAFNASGRVSESFAIVERIKERTQHSGDPGLLQAAAHSTAFHFLFGGDWASAAQWFQRLVSMPAVSENGRRTYSQYMTFPLAASGKLREAWAISTRYPLHGGLEVALAYYSGDWDKSLAWLEEFEAQSFTGSIWDQVADTLCTHGDILRTMGDLESAEQFLRRATERCGELVYFEFRARRDLILVYSELQLKDKAASEIERCRKIIADAGDFRSFVGDLHRVEGILAGLSGNIPKADSWFASAVQISRRYSLPFDEADTFHYWGRALSAHGDAIEARAKFDAAIEIYHRVGAGRRWIERIEKAAASSRSSVDSSRTEHNQFRRDGTQWSIVYQGKALRMKDSKGIRYLVHLLQYPQQEFHVLDLANSIRKPDADASVLVLDPKAKAQYSRRLNDLRAEHQDAERCNDLGRVASAQEEIEALTEQLSTSLGLGGRSRQFPSNAERARVAVSKRIKATIAQIRDLNPDLSRHLASSVSTGNFCSYRPDPKHPIDWQF